MIIVIVLMLSGCHQNIASIKEELRPDYYENYLEVLGYKDSEIVAGILTHYDVNMLYQSLEIPVETESQFIYHYTCYDNNGQKYNAIMPDRVGEQDIVFIDPLNNLEAIRAKIDEYNQTTNGISITTPDGLVETMDIVFIEQELSLSYVSALFVSREINGKPILVDEESIKLFIESYLSLPIIYRIGRYYDGTSMVKSVYLGKGFDGQYVLILEDYEKANLQILNQFTIEP